MFSFGGGWNTVLGTLITSTRGSGAVHGSVQKASEWKNKRLRDAVSTEGGCAAQVLSNGALPKTLPQSTPNHDPGGTNSGKGSTGNQSVSWDSLQEVSLGKYKGQIWKFSYFQSPFALSGLTLLVLSLLIRDVQNYPFLYSPEQLD